MSNIPWGWILGGSILGITVGALLSQDAPRARRNPYAGRKNPMDLDEMQKKLHSEADIDVELSGKSEGVAYLREKIDNLQAENSRFRQSLKAGNQALLDEVAEELKDEKEAFISEREQRLSDTNTEITALRDQKEKESDAAKKQKIEDRIKIKEDSKTSIEKTIEGYKRPEGSRYYIERKILAKQTDLDKLNNLLGVFEEEARIEEDDNEEPSSFASAAKKANDLKIKKAISALAKRSKKRR